MKCNVIGCSYYKVEDYGSICSVYLIFDGSSSTHILMVSEPIFRKVTGIKSNGYDFASKCATCKSSNCKLSDPEISPLEIFSTVKGKSNEFRRYNRIVVNAPCMLISKDKRYSGKLVNISIVGALIEIDTNHSFSIDEEVHIESYIDATKSGESNSNYVQKLNVKETLQGTIVWSVENSIGLRFNAQIEPEQINKYINIGNTPRVEV